MEISLTHLAMSLLTVGVTVFLIHFIRKFGDIASGFIGPDLNLLSFGFLWDTIAKASLGETYWPGYPVDDATMLPSGVTLALMSFVNVVLLLWNFKLAHRVPGWANPLWRGLGKSLITAIGLLSGLFFVFAQTVWGTGP